MKIISNLMIVFLAVSFIVSCKNTPEGEAAKTEEASATVPAPSADAKVFEVTNGQVAWTATKVGGILHTGEFQISKGRLAVENEVITNGIFIIDINSMTETTLSPDRKSRFLNHMKSDDFFDVAKHPASQFDLVSVTPLSGNAEANFTVKGNLTLRGVAKSISFPAKIESSGDRISVSSPKFTINRTDWGIKYDSAIIGTAADRIIHDEVSLSLRLEAAGR